MKKWIILLAVLVLFAVIALAIPAYARSALAMGIGVLAKTVLDQAVENFNAK